MPRRTTKQNKQRTFTGANLAMISFPLGGIGTGSVGLSGRGGLVDWEIFNRPNVGGRFPRTFPLIWAREQGQDPVCRVLMAPPLPPYQGGGGGDPHEGGEGFPHMDGCTFRGEYPFAWIDFASKRLPLRVRLEAYNPFIPSEPDDSGFPAAILIYTLTNTARRPVRATVAWSVLNMIGSLGVAERDPSARQCLEFGLGDNVNRFRNTKDLRGLQFTSKQYGPKHPRFGSMALTTPDKSVTALTHWSREGWFSAKHDFWDTFSATGRFPERRYGPSPEGRSDAGALGVRVNLEPGESRTVTFYLTWYFPNYEKYWGLGGCCEGQSCKPPTWRNYYAGQFKDAWDAAQQLHRRELELHAATKTFHGALFKSSLPATVLDAVSSQMAILKTTTCLRLPDGTFYGFEGCSPASGCCEGSCTHVWNYQQALAFLFPSLERSMRSCDYKHNLRKDGGMCFRLQLPLGAKPNEFHAAADGQLGGVIKTYRDWKISGDDAWLRGLWPDVKRSLEYAWKKWDPKKSGVITGIQHNTYDIEFLGPNPLIMSFYLGALLAGAEMAAFMGEDDAADLYRKLAKKGRAWVDKHLFNGSYYIQRYKPNDAPEYQFGRGCLADQVLGQQLASLAGLPHVLDRGHVRKTLRSIFRHNWRSDLREHANAQRVYALHDEAGLLLCSWPKGGRPRIPFPYSDEVWTGIEYQVAAHLIFEGFVDEGLAVVEGARARHDGLRRNPWDEFECGHHYARAMSSYGLLVAFSGFTFDKGAGRLGFAPKVGADDFTCFWALDGVWGTYTQTKGDVTAPSICVNCKYRGLRRPRTCA
jgi:uncharacterized protein (DUF608 family)